MDFKRVLGEVKRTAYVGVGTFASASVGNGIESVLPDSVSGGQGSSAVALSQVVLGATSAAVVDDRLNSRETRGLKFDMGEAGRHAAYGVGGAGFAELADELTEGSTQQEMVQVRTRSHAGSTGSGDGGNDEDQSSRERISVDI